MRRAFFFLVGISAASVLLLLFSEKPASSARKRRPPRLRGREAIVFKDIAKHEGQELLEVVFSHSSHARFGVKKCTICHNDEVFSEDQSLGANNITMDEIYQGKWCGYCHNGKTLNKEGKPIFGPMDGKVRQCVLCHNVKARKKPDPSKAWKAPKDLKPHEGPIVK